MLYIHSSFFLMVIPFIHGSDQKLPAARSPLSRTAAWTTEMSSSGVVNVSCRGVGRDGSVVRPEVGNFFVVTLW